MKYSSTEEKWNIGTHAFGLVASGIGLIILLDHAANPTTTIAAWVFGLSLCILYTASTSYHAATNEEKRRKLRIFDHAAIFILIAGTYTPVCLLPLWDSVGLLLLTIIWSIAIIGIVLKIYFTGKYDRASTFMYVAMGWVAIFAIKPLLDCMDPTSLIWLLTGGVFYTIGAILYSIKKIPFNHAIFHVFVLGGSASHYRMIYEIIG